ncbi:MAG: OmpH family outer membrane protein [Bacteroidetes bacterium]|nr:OmpH family outer membrane protein [Bacteroidota bacterium]
MKNNISTLLNVVLLIAVIILFYLHFSGTKNNGNEKTTAAKKDTVPQLSFNIPKNLAGAHVLFVNIDSIDAKYDAFADLSKEANNNYNAKMKQYQDKAAALQARYDGLQQQVNLGTISSDDASKEEASINAGMEDLKKMETEIQYLENQAMQKNATITDDITNYFKVYSQSHKIDYILGYGGGNTGVLFANDSLNITLDVVKALNENYAQNKNKPKGTK